MIITRTEDFKLGELKNYYRNGGKSVTIKTVTYWLLFVPVFTSKSIVDNRS